MLKQQQQLIFNGMMKIFKRDFTNYEGVRPINIYLLRLLFILMSFFLSLDSWTHIISHTGSWAPADAAAWCMWAAFGLISFIGIIRPLKMLPIVVFEIIYKVIWLLVVAYPVWSRNQLAWSPVEYTTYVFLGVIAPILFMPWRYFAVEYIMGKEL
jgi:hypothetical protein